MFLMFKDTKVIYFDFNEFIVEVIDNNLVPFCIRDMFRLNNTANNIAYNMNLLREYLGSRVLSLSKDNAKKIYALFQIPQQDTLTNRINIIIKCKGVSVLDNYWIKQDNENLCWNDVNIRRNKFKEIIDVSLEGSDPSVTVNPVCPELTSKGLFRKGWIRNKNTGDLYLLKSDRTTDFVNTKMEVLASQILHCFNYDNFVTYTGRYRTTKQGKLFVDKCESFIHSDDVYFVEAWEVINYCNNHNMDFETMCLNQFGSKFANIPIIDYCLINTDRHTENYGFICRDGQIIGVAPLFDFNLALVADYFGRYAEDTLSQMFNKNESIVQTAWRYIGYSDLVLDYNKIKKLRSSKPEYKAIINNVITRYEKAISW